MRLLLLLPQYIAWHYYRAPRQIIAISRNLVWFAWHLFSVGTLLATLFAPWERMHEDKPRRFDPNEYFEVVIINGVMRAVGAFIRTVFICMGLLMIAGVAVGAVGFMIVWLVLPLVALALIFVGLILIIKPA